MLPSEESHIAYQKKIACQFGTTALGNIDIEV